MIGQKVKLESFVARLKAGMLVHDLMLEQGVTQSDLARRLGMSRQAIHQHLTGGIGSVTLLSRMLWHLGYRVEFRVVPKGERT